MNNSYYEESISAEVDNHHITMKSVMILVLMKLILEEDRFLLVITLDGIRVIKRKQRIGNNSFLQALLKNKSVPSAQWYKWELNLVKYEIFVYLFWDFRLTLYYINFLRSSLSLLPPNFSYKFHHNAFLQEFNKIYKIIFIIHGIKIYNHISSIFSWFDDFLSLCQNFFSLLH